MFISFSEILVTGLAEKGACLLDKILSLGSQSYGKTIFKVDYVFSVIFKAKAWNLFKSVVTFCDNRCYL